MSDPLREYRERVERYEGRGGPAQGHRGLRAHLDPIEDRLRADGEYFRAETAGLDEEGFVQRTLDKLPPVGETLAVGIAEEALNLVEMLAREPGNRILVMERQRALRARLDELVSRDYGHTGNTGA